jgi:TetR/AcrR family transcriptional regulator, cholesterol catabolism regulator
MVTMTNSTEGKIYDAALALFARKGFEGTGIREIAETAGVTTSTLYHYIGSKDDLLVDIMRTGMQALRAGADEVLVRHEDPRVQLAGLVRLHVWVHGVRQLAARVADTEVRSITGEPQAEILGMRDEYERLWRDVLHRGVVAGLFHVRNERLATIALLTMCTGVAQWYRPDGRIPLDEICDDHADWALALVGVEGDRSQVLARELGPPASYYTNPRPTEAQIAT